MVEWVLAGMSAAVAGVALSGALDRWCSLQAALLGAGAFSVAVASYVGG